MITFCIGSARAKRAYVKQISGGVLLDNIEVLFCSSENGRNYFAYAPVPFAEFTVRDYLSYRRALCKTKITDADIKALGLHPNKRLKRLSPAQMRCVQFLEKRSNVNAHPPVIINLDGCRYSHKNARALQKLLYFTGEAYVFVTDDRFGKADYPRKFLFFGKRVKRPAPRFYAARRLAERIGATRVSVM